MTIIITNKMLATMVTTEIMLRNGTRGNDNDIEIITTGDTADEDSKDVDNENIHAGDDNDDNCDDR
jgi:hypothetical protein